MPELDPDFSFSGEESNLSDGYLDSIYQIQVGSPISELSSEFAQAYPVVTGDSSNKLYALIFDSNFPARLDVMRHLKRMENRNISNVRDVGKIVLSVTKSERMAVVLEKPDGEKLSDVITRDGAFDEIFISEKILNQLVSAVSTFTEAELVHGRINPDNLYYSEDTGKIILGECLSDFRGYSQLPAYESLDSLLCHPAGKGDKDIPADYFAIGMVLLFMLTGKKPFDSIDSNAILHERLDRGSCDNTIDRMLSSSDIVISPRVEHLLKGLLTDQTSDRWLNKEIRIWLKKQEDAPPNSKLHKKSGSVFFNDKEYYSRKYLAHDIFKKWNISKRELDITALSRWMSLVLKRRSVAEELNYLQSSSLGEVIIPDGKIARIICLLDQYGPLRYQDLSCHISGIGTILAYSYIKGDREIVQQIATIFRDGIAEYWVRVQPESSNFDISSLSYEPSTIRKYLRKREVGFGIERCLYELNSSLPCQSPIMSGYYAVNLREVISVLDKVQVKKEDTDPIDRHIGGLIASRVNLTEELRIKSLQNFPYVSKNPLVITVGFLTLAQKKTGLKSLTGLTSWMNSRLSTLVEGLHSRLIRKDMKNNLNVASKDGNMNSIFQVIASPDYARRDLYGFHEAKNQYRLLAMRIAKLNQQSNIQRMAYQLGLRISVTISYLVCIITLLYVVFQAS